MKKDEKHVSLRIDSKLLHKFTYVAKYDDRSLNWLLLSLVRKCITEFEEQYGKIPEQTNEENENL